MILFMLVCGEAPFQEANDSETLTMIMDCRYTVPDHVSPSCHESVSPISVSVYIPDMAMGWVDPPIGWVGLGRVRSNMV